ncbi:MAG: PilZ domain-containing protein [Candidatus Hydrogenedentes bacterium]|nr:PilZ domain-containing protein [Candidatus Hydrogenedentota bacterium]
MHEDVEQYFEVGRAVVLHIKNIQAAEGRVRTYIRGWQRGAYLLLDIPAPSHSGAALRVGAECSLRFLAEGNACGCDSEIQALGSGANFSYVRVNWPQAVSCVRVRKHERINLHTLCTVRMDNGDDFEGELVDLSAGGCKILVPSPMLRHEHLLVHFELPDGSVIENIEVDVCASGRTSDGAWIGCEYHDPEESVLYDIEFFVATTLARLRADRHGANHVLIMEPDPKQVNELRLSLTDAGYEVTLAPGAVDGFFWLRLSRPAILLADANQETISGADVCKIVRSTRQFKNLPVIIYGGDAQAERDARGAGADMYFASTRDTKPIIAAVKNAVASAHAVPQT